MCVASPMPAGGGVCAYIVLIMRICTDWRNDWWWGVVCVHCRGNVLEHFNCFFIVWQNDNEHVSLLSKESER